MRTLIDLAAEDLAALTKLAAERGVSRASLMREAIEDYLSKRRMRDPENAFGLWRTAASTEDGLIYQERLRDEW